MTTAHAIQPITHAEREAAAYNNAMAAARRRDHVEHARLWAEYSQLHRERPPAVVEAMERSL